jgi:hypothetical protein
LVYSFVSLAKIENHYLASVTFYAPLAILYALYVRHRFQPSKELVDFVYYSVGVLSVVLFTWVSSEQIGELDLPRGDLQQAISENLVELEEAQRFSNLFFNEPNVLILAANNYLQSLESAPIQAVCVQEYGLHDGSRGIVYTDRFGAIIRRSRNLDLDAPIKVSKECENIFGGAPVTTNLFNFWKTGRLANFHLGKFPFSTIDDASQIEKDLHFFLPLKVTSDSMHVADFLEYLIGSDGTILPPTEIERFANLERESHSIPVNLTWFDHFISGSFSNFRDRLEFAIWPVIGIFLLSLKITTISKANRK